MIPGFTLIQDQSVFTDYMPRQGDQLLIHFELLGASGDGAVTVTGWTKSTDEATSQEVAIDDSLGSDSSVTISAGGTGAPFFVLDCRGSNMKDEVRFKFVGTAGAQPEDFEWVYLRVLGFVWFDRAVGV